MTITHLNLATCEALTTTHGPSTHAERYREQAQRFIANRAPEGQTVKHECRCGNTTMVVHLRGRAE